MKWFGIDAFVYGYFRLRIWNLESKDFILVLLDFILIYNRIKINKNITLKDTIFEWRLTFVKLNEDVRIIKKIIY